VANLDEIFDEKSRPLTFGLAFGGFTMIPLNYEQTLAEQGIVDDDCE
jgi:hypothetical protein